MSSHIGKNISVRIYSILEKTEGKQGTFANKIGVSQSFLSKVLRGESKASVEILIGITQAYPNINPTWLLTGQGEMYLSSTPNHATEEKTSQPENEQEDRLLTMFRALPANEQNEVIAVARKEAELAEMKRKIEEITRKTAA